MLEGKRIFISGGAGVIGTELVHKLHAMGAEVFVGDLKPRPIGWLAQIRYRQGDLNNICKEELDDFSPEYVFHLAATFERSVENYEFWGQNYWHNVNLSHHLLTCLQDNKNLKKVIFASSYLIYAPELYSFSEPAAKAVLLREGSPISPRNLTGMAKLFHEIELRFLGEFSQTGFETVVARIYRSYGKNSRDVISRWIRSLLKGEAINVYGKQGMFDYIYAGDVAEGLIRLATSSATGVVNLGRGHARRVEDVLNVLKTHFPAMHTFEVDMDIQYEASEANMEYFNRLTGWAPVRDIEDTIPELIAYERNAGGRETTIEVGNTLVTSISRKVPLIKSLKQAYGKLGYSGKIYGADLNPVCIGKHFVDDFWEIPALTELTAQDFISYCRTNEISHIIPTRDGELLFFANNKEELRQNGIHVMVSDSDAVEICLDKILFYEQLRTGFPVIKTVKDIKELSCQRYVVKEQFGAGSRYIGLDLTREDAVKHAKMLQNPIFQPFVSGQEYSVDLYVDAQGRAHGVVARKRDSVVNGESQITTTVRNLELEQLCCELAEKLGLYGHVVMQVIIDDDGNFNIVECNSRFGGASSLSVEAGLDSFYWFLLESAGNDLADYPFIRSKSEKKLVRYAEDLVTDDTRL